MGFTEGMTPADFAAVTRGNDDGFGGNGAWWLIVLFLFAFNGNWGGNRDASGAADNYVLASDFATLQRQIDSQTSEIKQGINGVANGLCDGFYTNAQLINGVNMNIAQNGYESRLATTTLGSQMQECCCNTRQQIADTNYNMATHANNIVNAMNTGFCTTNYNNSNNTRDILESNNANTQAIIAKLNQMEASAKDDKIAELTAMNADLRLAASQAAQNNYLVNQLRPTPIPAYVTCNPYAYNSGCGCA